MPGLFETLFGGTDTSAQEAQISSNAAIQRIIAENVAQARGDVLSLFPGGQDARNQSIQAALGILGQTIPQQLDVTQQASQGAQGALLAGLPQIQNAILGQPVNLSGLQSQQLNFDPSFAQQTLPNFQTIPQLLNPPQTETPAPSRFGGPERGPGRFGEFTF